MNIKYRIDVHPEDAPIRGNAIDSGDDEFDAELEAQIARDLEINEWAWCVVKVTAYVSEFPELRGTAYLGGCSYASEQEFRCGDYYKDLVAEAQDELEAKLNKLRALL
jgi:hypothetical protein